MPVRYGFLENKPVLSNHEPIPRIRVKGNHLPYITSDLRKMVRQRDYLRAKVNKTDSSILR